MVKDKSGHLNMTYLLPPIYHLNLNCIFNRVITTLNTLYTQVQLRSNSSSKFKVHFSASIY